MLLGIHQKFARQPDNSFVRRTTGTWRQIRNRRRRDVRADNGEVAVVEFPNVGTTTATGALQSVGLWIGADSA